MKNYIYIAAFALTSSIVSGQTLVSGWDFSSSSANDLTVNKSQIAPEAGLSSSDGTISMGSIQGFSGALWATTGSGLNSGLDVTTGAANDNFDASSAGLVVTYNSNFIADEVVFQATPTNLSQAPAGTTGFNAWSVSYAGVSSSSTVSLGWSFSTDGTSYTSISSDTLSSSDSAYSLSGFADTVTSDTLYLKADISNFTEGSFSLDNIAVYGTAVPEPSTYAALFGFVALVVAMVRRKK
tara:strand:+ start:1706 stop:2422 length:717 start_codon:yes stop_codon:yes gene_type:complete